MTIVAGFRVQDGILLCSDTMYTGGMKIQGQKLFPVTFGDGPHPEHFVFALAGSEAYGKMAIDECTEAIRDLGPQGRTLRAVKSTLRDTIKTLNDRYIDCRPENERAALDYQLLIGAWLPLGGGAKLFSTVGSAVNLCDAYECIGTGSYLAHYLIRPVFTHTLKMEAVRLLATQVLAAAKGYDANCGGHSTFTIITDKGELKPVFDYPFYQVEQLVAQYESLSKALLFFTGDESITDEDFTLQLSSFSERVKLIRQSWRQNIEARRRISEMVQRVNETKSSTDQT